MTVLAVAWYRYQHTAHLATPHPLQTRWQNSAHKKTVGARSAHRTRSSASCLASSLRLDLRRKPFRELLPSWEILQSVLLLLRLIGEIQAPSLARAIGGWPSGVHEEASKEVDE